jgi:hypothetical protein
MTTPAAFVRARLAEINPRTELEVHELTEGVTAILNEYVARDEDANLMLGPPVDRQVQWNGLRLAVRLLATEWSTHPDYQQEWSAP